jgi:hypothetical protein
MACLSMNKSGRRSFAGLVKKTTLFLCLAFVVLTNGHAFGQNVASPAPFGPHTWSATVKVIGEDGRAVPGASVDLSYDVPTPDESDKPQFGEVKASTDSNGTFIATHTDSSLNLGIIAEKPGYYATHTGWQFYFDDKRRHPSFTLMLKKIGNPVPMYAKSVNLGMPVFNKPVGFDLEAGDWVAPYGKGVTADFLFIENHLETKSGYTFTVNFPNNGDGIQEFNVPALLRNATMGQSDLRSSQEAPADGYQPQYEQTQGPDLNRNYYFWVRTILDSKGNILSTHYGKVYGDFMQFRYYLNPTPNDRNVEFDPKHNLLGGFEIL